jgi:hypothetical protein
MLLSAVAWLPISNRTYVNLAALTGNKKINVPQLCHEYSVVI